MRTNRFLQFGAAVFFAGVVNGAPIGKDLLKQLSAELTHARSLPMGTPTDIRCPERTDSLVGLSSADVRKALGKPDFVEPAKPTEQESKEVWWYFFTSPLPLDQMGGGFPELGFTFSKKHKVVRTLCHYAR